jgi:hypothetical protein
MSIRERRRYGRQLPVYQFHKKLSDGFATSRTEECFDEEDTKD